MEECKRRTTGGQKKEMMTIEEIRDDIREKIINGSNAFTDAVNNIRGDITKVDKELDIVRSQNEQIGKDIAHITIPEGKTPLTAEEVRAIVKDVYEDGEKRAKFRHWILSLTIGVLFILTWAIAHFVYG